MRENTTVVRRGCDDLPPHSHKSKSEARAQLCSGSRWALESVPPGHRPGIRHEKLREVFVWTKVAPVISVKTQCLGPVSRRQTYEERFTTSGCLNPYFFCGDWGRAGGLWSNPRTTRREGKAGAVRSVDAASHRGSLFLVDEHKRGRGRGRACVPCPGPSGPLTCMWWVDSSGNIPCVLRIPSLSERTGPLLNFVYQSMLSATDEPRRCQRSPSTFPFLLGVWSIFMGLAPAENMTCVVTSRYVALLFPVHECELVTDAFRSIVRLGVNPSFPQRGSNP